MISKKISWLLSALLVRDEFRSFVGRTRFRMMRKNLRSLDTGNVPCLNNTLSHNLSALDHIGTDFHMRRMKWLVFGAIANELVSPSSHFLMIGPRTENEILLLKGLGYTNVVGLDLISYSPWVKLGDMHQMPFENNSFEVVICGWTISYSKEPERLAQEIVRVLRQGGVFALGLEHATASAAYCSENRAGLIDPAEALQGRINTTAQIKNLFEQHGKVDTVLQYDALLAGSTTNEQLTKTGLGSSQVLFVGRITKPQ
jgi:SAM-dependent methyltransferase